MLAIKWILIIMSCIPVLCVAIFVLTKLIDEIIEKNKAQKSAKMIDNQKRKKYYRG